MKKAILQSLALLGICLIGGVVVVVTCLIIGAVFPEMPKDSAIWVLIGAVVAFCFMPLILYVVEF